MALYLDIIGENQSNVYAKFLYSSLSIYRYSQGLELNPASNWTRVNLPNQIEKLKSF